MWTSLNFIVSQICSVLFKWKVVPYVLCSLNNLKHITCSHMLGYGFFINKLCMLNSRSFIVFQTCGFSLSWIVVLLDLLRRKQKLRDYDFTVSKKEKWIFLFTTLADTEKEISLFLIAHTNTRCAWESQRRELCNLFKGHSSLSWLDQREYRE